MIKGNGKNFQHNGIKIYVIFQLKGQEYLNFRPDKKIYTFLC